MAGRRARTKHQSVSDGPQCPVILCLVPDFLLLNVKGEPKREVVEWLESEQQSLRESGEKWGRIEIPGCPGGHLYLTWKRRKGYQVRFHNHDFYGELTSFKNLPTFRIRIQSRVLNTGNWDLIQAKVGAVGSYFMRRIASIQVSRVDLAVDFQMRDFELPELHDVVSRASSMSCNLDDKTGLEALVLGKRSRKKGSKRAKDSKMQAILYNKSAKIEIDGQNWMLDVYRKADGYDEDLTVYRAELRFFREMLRESKRKGQDGRSTGIETITDLRESLGDLVRIAVGGENHKPWLRFCDPETREQDSRPATEWWSSVAEAFKQGLTVSGRFREYKRSPPSFSRDRTMLLTYSARMEAHARLSDPSHRTELDDFPSFHREQMRIVLRSRSTTWEQMIQKTMKELTATIAEAELSEDEEKAA